ncbi:MAG: alpha/beta hydrolase [Actinomycetota bacterium]|nr:alpha/beta hydrolase [Actinomycetota bacterium]
MTMHPPIDRELNAALLMEPLSLMPSAITPEMIGLIRAARPPIDPIEVLAGTNIEHEDVLIPGPPGAPEIAVTVLRHASRRRGGPGIFFVHGGGMIGGQRMEGVEAFLDFIENMDAVLVTVTYRLAPDSPDPAPIEDCYAGLVWMSEHADELGFDPGRLVIAGISAGAGLAAGTALLCRDRNGPSLFAQVLICPMLDDRNESISSRQIDGVGIWDRTSNDTGWTALLGERQGGSNVSIYAAPGRAADLTALPPTYIDVGSVEVFRDEAVAFASAIWACGGEAELHVWPGGFHGFEFFVPQARLSRHARESRDRWLRWMLEPEVR